MSLYYRLSVAMFGVAMAGATVYAHQVDDKKTVAEAKPDTKTTKPDGSEASEVKQKEAPSKAQEADDDIDVAPLEPIYLTGSSKNDVIAKAKPNPDKVLDVAEVKSDKGFTAWLVQHPGLDVVTFVLRFKDAGSKVDPEGKKGLADLLSAMLDEGAGDMDSAAFARHLLRKNIKLAIANGKDGFSLSFRCTRANLAEAFKMLQLVLTKPRLAPEDLSRVKNQLQVELAQSMKSEGVIAKNVMAEIVYPSGHPYRVTTADKLRDLQGLTREDMQQFMQQRFVQDNMIVGVAGDITAEELKNHLDKTFSVLPVKAAAFKAPESSLQGLGSVQIKKIDSPQSHIMFIQKGLKRSNPDFYAMYLMNHALGGGMQNCRLWEEMREKNGLVYYIWSHLIYTDHAQVWAGVTATKNDKVKEAMAILNGEWQKMVDKGMTDKELASVKKQVLGQYALSIANTRSIAAKLVQLQDDGLDKEYPNTRVEKINAVTVADIKRVAQEHIKPSDLTFVLVGQPEGVEEKVVKTTTASDVSPAADDVVREDSEQSPAKDMNGKAAVTPPVNKTDQPSKVPEPGKLEKAKVVDKTNVADKSKSADPRAVDDLKTVEPIDLETSKAETLAPNRADASTVNNNTPAANVADASKDLEKVPSSANGVTSQGDGASATAEKAQEKLIKPTSSIKKSSAADIYNQLMDEPKDLSDSDSAKNSTRTQPK